MIGIIYDANNISKKFTRGRFGASMFTGTATRRYQFRSELGSLLGPTYDLVAGAMQVTGSAAAEMWLKGQAGWTAASAHAARKLLPLESVLAR